MTYRDRSGILLVGVTYPSPPDLAGPPGPGCLSAPEPLNCDQPNVQAWCQLSPDLRPRQAATEGNSSWGARLLSLSWH